MAGVEPWFAEAALDYEKVYGTNLGLPSQKAHRVQLIQVWTILLRGLSARGAGLTRCFWGNRSRRVPIPRTFGASFQTASFESMAALLRVKLESLTRKSRQVSVSVLRCRVYSSNMTDAPSPS